MDRKQTMEKRLELVSQGRHLKVVMQATALGRVIVVDDKGIESNVNDAWARIHMLAHVRVERESGTRKMHLKSIQPHGFGWNARKGVECAMLGHGGRERQVQATMSGDIFTSPAM